MEKQICPQKLRIKNIHYPLCYSLHWPPYRNPQVGSSVTVRNTVMQCGKNGKGPRN